MPENLFSPMITAHLSWGGILCALAVIAMFVISVRLQYRFGSNNAISCVIRTSPYIIILGFIFSRIFYVTFSSSLYINTAQKWNFFDGGYSLIGAFIGGLIAIIAYFCINYAYAKSHGIAENSIRKNIITTLDALSIGALCAVFIGRLTGYFNRDCYGSALGSESSIGFPFAVFVPSFGDWHWATFALEAILCAICAAVLYYYHARLIKTEGSLSFITITFYCTMRIFTESLRQDCLYLGFVKISQVVCAIIVISAFLYISVKAMSVSGFNSIYILTFTLFFSAVTVAFLAEFYMGSQSRGRNLTFMLISCIIILSVILGTYYLYNKKESRNNKICKNHTSQKNL